MTIKTSSELIRDNPETHFRELKRTASLNQSSVTSKKSSPTSRIIKHASVNVNRQSPDYFHPLYEPVNLQLPTKLRECIIPYITTVMGDGRKKRIDEVKIGDWILDKNGDRGQVEDVIINEIDEDIYKLKLATIETKLEITGNHKIFCIKKEVGNCRHKSNEIKFCQKNITAHCRDRYKGCVPQEIKVEKVRVDELEIGDFMLSPIATENKLFDIEVYKYKSGSNRVFELQEVKPINKNIMRLFGYFLAEGNFYRRKDGVLRGMQFSFNISEKDTYVAEVKELLEKEFGATVNINLRKDVNTCLVTTSGKKLAELFYEHCGEYSHYKRISQQVMDCPPELQIELVKAYINGDGHVDKTGDIRTCSASKDLSDQIHEILKRCQIMSIVRKEERDTGFAGDPGYSLSWNVEINNNEATKLGIKNKSKWNSHRRWIWNNYIVLEIKGIELEEYKGKVYNLTIEGEHSYVANNVAVANCNQWSRHYTRTEPIVNTGVHLNAEFPVTGLRNVCEDPKIQKYFDELAFDILKLPQILRFISLEFNMLGNAIPFGLWDDDEGRWDKFVTLNPDYVEIESNIFADPIIKLDPDDALKRIVNSKKPIEIYNSIDPQIRSYVSKNQKVPLSNFEIVAEGRDEKIEIPQVSHLANKHSMYEVYGVSPLKCIFKALIYKDMLRRAQFAIAKRHWRPIKVVKVGDETHPATEAVLQNVANALDQASSDPNSWLIWHNYINFDYISSAGKIIPLTSELDFVDKEILSGLGISKALITTEGVTFANASVALQVLVNRYLRFQDILSEWVIEYVYKPVAKVQGFYKTNDEGESELIVPEIEWELMRLKDDAQQKTLYQNMQQRGLISKKTLLTYLGLDLEKEEKLIEKERKKDIQLAQELKNIQTQTGINVTPTGAPAAAPGTAPATPAPGGAPGVGGGGAKPPTVAPGGAGTTPLPPGQGEMGGGVGEVKPPA